VPPPYALHTDAHGYVCPGNWLDWLEVLKFDWSRLLLPGTCLVGGLKFRLLLRGLVPLLFMLGPPLLSIASYTISYCHARIVSRAYPYGITTYGEGVKAAVLRALPSVIFISFWFIASR
jgi:hypothetical protein